MFCDRALWLDDGHIESLGDPKEVTSRYMQRLVGGADASSQSTDELTAPGDVADESSANDADESPVSRLLPLAGRADLTRWGSGEIKIESAAIWSDDGAGAFEHGGRIHVELEAVVQCAIDDVDVSVGFSFRNTKGLDIITFTTWEAGERFDGLSRGVLIHASFELENILAPGDYSVVLAAEEVRGRERHYYDFVENACVFTVVANREIFSVVAPSVRHSVSVSEGTRS